MADEATLLVKIKTILDKSSVMKDIKVIGDKVQDAVGLKGAGSSGSTSNSNDKGILGQVGVGMKKGLGVLSKGIGLIGKIFASVSIGVALLDVFKPVISIANGIVKMVSEFIRPISDIFVILLSPMLTMLKPIVQMFRVLMAPFKKLAMQGLAASNVLISQGMKIGGDTGNLMIESGFEGAISSAGLMMSGFLEATIGKLLKDVPYIGDAVTKNINNLENASLKGIMKVMEKVELIKDIGKNINLVSVETLEGYFLTINNYVDELALSVGGFSIKNFEDNLIVAKDDLGNVFNPLINLLKGDSTFNQYIINTSKAMDNLGSNFLVTARTLTITMSSVAQDWKQAIESARLSILDNKDEDIANKTIENVNKTYKTEKDMTKLEDNIISKGFVHSSFSALSKVSDKIVSMFFGNKKNDEFRLAGKISNKDTSNRAQNIINGASNLFSTNDKKSSLDLFSTNDKKSLPDIFSIGYKTISTDTKNLFSTDGKNSLPGIFSIGYGTISTDTKNLFSTDGENSLPGIFSIGYGTIQKDTNLHFGSGEKSGTIPAAISKGFTTMNTSGTNFTKTMKDVAIEIGKIANSALSSAKIAALAAARAAVAAKKASEARGGV